MNVRFVLSAALLLTAFALPPRPAHAGGQLPPVEVEGFAHTKARSFDDFAGRAVLIEFFAYW